MRRIFATVSRGMTDKTAVCIFPWELAVLSQIHGGEVQEVSIDEMCHLKGAVKVQKNAFKRQDGIESESAPALRAQLEAMAFVPDDEDPANDPETEYSRLVDKYGMDKEVPLPVVTRVYGELISGAFAAALKAAAAAETPRAPKPSKPVAEMTINELREELKAQGIDYDRQATKAELQDLLETATA